MLTLLSLRDFESPKFDDLGTVSFINNAPLDCTAAEIDRETQPFSNHLRDFPTINITPDMLATRETHRTIGARDLFLPVQDSAFKKIVSIWREKGLLEAIRTAAGEDPTEITTPVHWIATKITQMMDVIEGGSFWSSVLPTTGSGSIVDVVSTRDWMTALVRCIAWHPHCIRIAVATRDDRIRIFSTGNIGTATLRHSGQKSVCCMSWRPYSGRELAAACQNGVLIWQVELGAASNSLSHAFMLKYRNHAPVTSVSWSPQGDVLVSCSLTDMNMIIWDVAKESGLPLRRVGGGGLCFTRWSPCGSRLLATTCRKIFRVWNTGVGTPWTTERWTVPSGRVAAACFGPNLTLLFTSTEDPAMVFSLPLQEQIFDVKKVGTHNDAKVAAPLIDLSKVTFSSDEGDVDYTVGGRVVSMDWDSLGKYLAIIFQDSPVVAIFKTTVGSISRIEVKPLCLVRGFYGEVPSCIQFYPNHQQNPDVSILTIAWSSGSVRHFPIIETDSTEIQSTMCKTTNAEEAGIDKDREELIELAVSVLRGVIDKRVEELMEPSLRLIAKLCASNDDIAKKFMEGGCELYHILPLRGVSKILECMIARGSQLEARDQRKNSALHLAVQFADLQSVQILLDAGANFAARNRSGKTPLSLLDFFSGVGHSRDSLSILDLWLERFSDKLSLSDLEHLLKYGNGEAVARLIRCEVLDFGATIKANQNALHFLADNWERGVAEQLRLYPYGYAPYLKTSSASFLRSLLEIALEGRNLNMAEFFLEQALDMNLNIQPVHAPIPVGIPPTFLYVAATTPPPVPIERYLAIYYAIVREFMELFLYYNDDPQIIFVDPDSGELQTIVDVVPQVLIKPVIAHLAMLHKSGGNIKAFVYSKIALHQRNKQYFEKCLAVLELEISESLTLLKLLTANDKQFLVYLRSEKLLRQLIRLMHKLKLRKSLSYYCSSLKRRVTSLLRRKRLEENAAYIICNIFGQRVSEQHLVTERIIYFLDTNTLQIMSYM